MSTARRQGAPWLLLPASSQPAEKSRTLAVGPLCGFETCQIPGKGLKGVSERRPLFEHERTATIQRSQRRAVVAREHMLDRGADRTLDVFVADVGEPVGAIQDHADLVASV